MIPRRALDAYNQAVHRQGDAAVKAVRRGIEAWRATNPGASVAETREYCIGLLREVCETYGMAAGDAAYAMRDVCAEMAGVGLPSVDYTYVPDVESISRTVHYQAAKLDRGNTKGFIDALCEAARYYSERGANEAMFALTKNDQLHLGRDVRFARVPSGPTTCAWCLMLASRGFVYYTAATAGEMNRFHRSCDCKVLPGYEDDTEVEGYDPDALYDQWQNAIDDMAAKRAEKNGTTVEQEHDRIMSGYARSAAKARGRTAAEYRSYHPESSKNFIPDDKAKKQAQVLTRGLTKETDRDRVIERIVKGQEQWDKSVHSVEMDNYYAERVGRAMVEHGLSITEIDRYAQAYYAGAIR